MVGHDSDFQERQYCAWRNGDLDKGKVCRGFVNSRRGTGLPRDVKT
jgi:hypothetical protein